jgi:hypothetical protein
MSVLKAYESVDENFCGTRRAWFQAPVQVQKKLLDKFHTSISPFANWGDRGNYTIANNFRNYRTTA